MADGVDFSSKNEFDFELDVSFNEFENELQLENEKPSEPISKQAYTTVDNEICEKSLRNSGHSEVFPTFLGELSHEEASHKQGLQSPSIKRKELEDDEENILNTDEEFETESLRDSRGKILSEGKVKGETIATCSNLKRTHQTLLEDEIEMDIDEDGLLDSEEETSSGKKMKTQENGDQVIRSKRLKKKRKKDRKLGYLNQKLQSERKVHPTIGRLFKPLTANEDDTPEWIAVQLAERLQEKKTDLIERVVQILGKKAALDMFKETREIQKNGGMMTNDCYRKRTSGGIFLYIMKTKGYATKSQIKDIYAEEREREKKLLKERKKREKEKEDKDLRELLANKRDILTKLDNDDQTNA